jgi:magnesium-protoporphyrin IX monomethyl ester (oxidative) cyclase
MEEMYDLKKNPNLNMDGVDQLVSTLEEFRRDYNQKHFVRNETFKVAADKLQGPIRKIFVEFLERGCTAGEQGVGA